MSGRIPEDERTLRLGGAFENYLEEANKLDELCEHSFVIFQDGSYLCKDCNETFAEHPADWNKPIPVAEPIEVEEPEYLLASGVVTTPVAYQFPVINSGPVQTILASGVSNSSFANFAKPLARAVFPQEIADEMYKVTK